jgi:TolB-like protein/Tfp pilus assembly protein PilF
MSSDEDQEYFSDGITEEIINAVVKIPGVSVPARTTVFAYKGHQGDLREVGETLGVAHILEGSIRSQGDQIRVTAQLIKVEDGFHLWSETFDRQLDNIFAVQEEIANAIAAELVGNLGGAPVTIPNQTSNMVAYDAYLKGRAALRDRDPVARVYLQQAIDADPQFAPAYAAMAISYQSNNEDPDLAVGMADLALALDPDNVDALNAKAAAWRDHRRWLEAESLFQQALAIDPSSAELLEDYAEFLAFVGRMDEALQATSRGMSIDPNLMPLIAAHFEALYANGEGARAWQLAAQDSTDQGWRAATMWLAAIPLWLDQSLFTDFGPAPPRPENLQNMGQDMPDWAQQALGLAGTATTEGSRALSPQDVETLKSFYGVRTVGSKLDRFFGIAIARSLLISAGEIEHVMTADLSLIERGLDPLHEWQWTPSRAELRQDPRFTEYLSDIGLIEYWDATSWPPFCERNPEGVIQCQ